MRGFFGLFTTIPTTHAQQSLPEEYYPNFHVAQDYEELLDYFIDIEAAAKVGTGLQEDLFIDINKIFRNIFNYFPQSSTNEVVYRQCILITDDLSDGVTRAKYSTFKERCYEPLGTIIRQINSVYTVEAKVTAAPKKGSAPLNVTFDARESKDPSNDTIPSANYYRWYKDVYGIEQAIGRGPVVNYTFTEPGNHVVHLTVRSSNNYEDGIFDGEASIEINVAPKAANMVVYINGQQATETKLLKIGSQDAERGVLIDATATVPLGARTIVEHEWTIRSAGDSRYEDITPGAGAPGQFIYQFPTNGVYTIELKIIDNEGNRLSEKYNVSISDPVATMKYKPEKGSTSTEFTFDAGASYSITSRIRNYQRVITNPNGKQIESIESKELKRTFSVPGTYTMKLTVTDEQGNSSIDTQQLYVASTPPIPSFIVTPQSEWKHPSQFILDASGTFDEDVRSGNDALSYSWSFSNSSNVNIDRVIEEDNSKIRVSMQEPGTYKVKLIVEDRFGERQEIEKDIKVASTLRPDVLITPQVGVWGEEVGFFAKVNKPVAFYQWDFGDGNKQQSKEPKVTHVYEKAGSYEVKLQVITEDSEENEVKKGVFMGQKDYPVAAYSIKGAGNTELKTSTSCDDGNEAYNAYLVERYQNLVIDAGDSTNAQGQNTDLSISFHPKNDQVYNKTVLSYGFPEIGCTYVDLFVEDSNVGKTEKTRIWFKVINALPQLQNLTLTFPQTGGGNPIGIGGNPTDMSTGTDLFSNASIIVKVQAKGARDPDGFISHYRWYYYPSDDPLRKEGFKITPGDVPYATFVIPKPMYATEYAFAVEMIDNDDGKVSSESVVGKGPIVFFPPEEDSLDVPLVTFTVNKLTARVGEEITFTTKSSTISENPDFVTNRYFKYDFDGDGVYDIPSTKKEVITHTFNKAGTYKPKVSVYFKGRAGVGTTETMTILKGLRPSYEVSTFGNKALVKDFSDGDIIQSSFCMDSNACDAASGTGFIVDKSVFLYEYPKSGRYLSRLDVIDEFSNEQDTQKYVDITETNEPFGLLSMPASTTNNAGSSIVAVSQSALDVHIYPVRTGVGNCFVDLDNTSDSNGDGDPLYDQDIRCNELATITLFPKAKQQYGTIYYVLDGSIIEKELVFDFFDYEPPINDERNRAREEINTLIKDIEENNISPQGVDYYKELLINLRVVLGETYETNSIIAQILDYVEQNPLLLTTGQHDDLKTLLAQLSSKELKEVYGATTYETAKSEITTRFSQENRKTILSYFDEFESAQGNRETMKGAVDKIYTFSADARKNNLIDEVDFNYIKVQLCTIVDEYDLPSVTCGTAVDTPTIGDNSDSSSGSKTSLMKTILKIFLWVVIGLVIIFGIIVVIFAIKAKKQNQKNEEKNSA